LNLDTEIVLGPIIRESDGLAMSSRNVYLSAEERVAARVLHRALNAARERMAAGERSAEQLQEAMQTIFAGEPLAKVDYAEIVDADTFEPVTRIGRPCYILLAAYLGQTRLIDNMFITQKEGASEALEFQL